MIFAEATAADLLAAIPFYDAVDCDLHAISVAFIRHTKNNGSLAGFKVKGLPFPASNFSNILLILSPLVRQEGERRTLAPVAAWLRLHEVTNLRITGSGAWQRSHEYSRNGGRSWGRMPVQGQAPAQPAPTQVIEPAIPPAPEEVPDHANPLPPAQADAHPAPALAAAGAPESGRAGAAAVPEVTP